ncbi:MAG: hypothetical protein Q8N77_06470 [Nanoarchaeota archaeon]|nr:hypothetical protein [Nanoarchaeota archaeon]
MYKKGDISLNYIIIAALALVALVVIILFFTGGMQKLITGQKEVVEGVVPNWKISAWTTRCEFACTQQNKVDFCKTVFKADTNNDKQDDTYYVCNSAKSSEDTTTLTGLTKQSLEVQCDKIPTC